MRKLLWVWAEFKDRFQAGYLAALGNSLEMQGCFPSTGTCILNQVSSGKSDALSWNSVSSDLQA